MNWDKAVQSLYYDQPYNMVADVDSDGVDDIYTVVPYDDGTADGYLNGVYEGTISFTVDGNAIAGDFSGTISTDYSQIAVDGLGTFTINTTKHDIYWGKAYSATMGDESISIALNQDGSGTISENGEAMSLPAGSFVIDGYNIIDASSEEVFTTVSMDGTQLVVKGQMILTYSESALQFGEVYGNGGISFIFNENGTANMFSNGAECDISPLPFVYTGNTISFAIGNFTVSADGKQITNEDVKLNLIDKDTDVLPATLYQDLDNSKSSLNLIGFTGTEVEFEIPETYIGDDGVTYKIVSLGGPTFFYSDDLTSVTIPNSVELISDMAFNNLPNLTNINIDANNPNYCSVDGVLYTKDMTTLHTYPMDKTDASFVIPESVINIGSYAFYTATYSTSVDNNLTSIIIPDSVTIIGSNAFYRCINLTDVYYTGTEDQWNAITTGQNNPGLTNATIHYNYVPE